MSRLHIASPRSHCFSALAFLGLTSVLLAPRPADACSAPPQPVATLGASEVPVDGVVVFRLGAVDSTDDLLVKHGEDEVAGTFAALDGSTNLYTWTPAAELTVDAEYSIQPREDLDDHYYEGAPFTAVAASAENPELTTRLTKVTYGSEPVQCSASATDTLGTCNSYPSLYESSYFEPRLEVLLTGANRGQFLYEVEWSSGGEPTKSTKIFSNALAHTFAGTPASVCYSLIAHPLDGGAELDLGDACFDTAELALKPTDDDVGNRTAFFQDCLVPPTSSAGAKMTREWCDAFRSQIDAGNCTETPTGQCESALELCSDEGSGGAPGDDDLENEGVDESGGGCSVSNSNRVNSTPAALALAVAAAGLALRRRRALARASR